MLNKETIVLHLDKCFKTKLSDRLFIKYSEDSYFNFYIEFYNVNDIVEIYLNSDSSSEHLLLRVESIEDFSMKQLKININLFFDIIIKDIKGHYLSNVSKI